MTTRPVTPRSRKDRDAGLARIQQLTRWTLAGALTGTGLFAGLAAHATAAGKTTAAKTSSTRTAAVAVAKSSAATSSAATSSAATTPTTAATNPVVVTPATSGGSVNIVSGQS